VWKLDSTSELTIGFKADSLKGMKSKYLFLPLSVAVFMFSSWQALADPSITFDVIATFDYPNASPSTYPLGINDHGDTAGYFDHVIPYRRGFVRSRDGMFSRPIIDPASSGDVTTVTGINNANTVCGYHLGGVTYTSFFLAGTTFTEFDIAGSTGTEVRALNDAGDFCGDERASDGSRYLGFVSIGGTVSTFSFAGATFTFAYGINNLGQSVGYYDTTNASHGFRRDSDGTLTAPIDPPGARSTNLYGINDRGWMVGTGYDNAGGHGLFFQTVSRVTTFDYPGSTTTVFTGINNRGLICGWYQDSSFVSHGFIARVNVVDNE